MGSSKTIRCFWDHTVYESGGNYYIQPIKLKVIQIIIGHFQNIRIACRVSRTPPEGLVVLPENIIVEQIYGGEMTHSMWGHMWISLRSLLPVYRAVSSSNIIYSRHQGIPIFYYASLIALLRGRPLLVTIGGNLKLAFHYRDGFQKRASLLNWVKGYFFFFLDRLIAKKARLALISGKGLKSAMGNIGEVFSSDSFAESDIHRRLDCCQGSRIQWLYVGTLSVEKGVDILLEALRQTRKVDQRHCLTLVGKNATGPQWLYSIIEKYGLADSVIITGNVPFGAELFSIYRESDIFVFPSLHEGMPKSPMEALSQGLPVVATHAGGKEYIRDEQNGLIIEQSNPEAIVAAVMRIVEDGPLRRKLIRNALLTAEANTFQANCDHVGGLLRKYFPEILQ